MPNATTINTLAQAAIANSVSDGAIAAAISNAMGDVDKFWLLFGVCLVLIMQAGFMLLEVGCVREKNTKNILMKNLLDPCIGAVCWWTVGYGFAFGNTNKDIPPQPSSAAASGSRPSTRLTRARPTCGRRTAIT